MLEPTNTSDAASADRVGQNRRFGLAALAASRKAKEGGSARVQDGQSLSALRDTSTGVQQFSSGPLQSDGGRRSSSLFGLSNSGQGLVLRLRGQVRPSSPLNALRVGGSGGIQSSGGISSLTSLHRANAQLSGLRTALTGNDNSSRLLLSASSSSRSLGGFGQAATTRSAFDFIG
ncbi:MAG TPA: hypothetical protein DIC52_20710 [Candidatus Latescibacteria bacterium]|nr:hypothetical protein [Candidatus Latescibacterota bacterium]